MDDCERMKRATQQWLTNCPTPWLVDRAVGDMQHDSQAGPQFAIYVRYDVLLERDWLESELGPDTIEQIRKREDPSSLSDLGEQGRLAAAKQVKLQHLPAAFDLPKASA
jgi:hypothetical protein